MNFMIFKWTGHQKWPLQVILNYLFSFRLFIWLMIYVKVKYIVVIYVTKYKDRFWFQLIMALFRHYISIFDNTGTLFG